VTNGGVDVQGLRKLLRGGTIVETERARVGATRNPSDSMGKLYP
jgi:hypothetical protein